jgi:hypothetical protein
MESYRSILPDQILGKDINRLSVQCNLVTMDVDTIVDVDGHTGESVKTLAPYIENEVIREVIKGADAPLRDIYTVSRPGPSYYFQSDWYGTSNIEGDDND